MKCARYPAIVVALLLPCALLSAAEPARKAAVPEDVLKKVRAVLPRGWSAEVKGDEMIVRREQDVELEQYLPNAPSGQGPTRTKEQYLLRYRFGPRVDAAGYRRLHDEIDRRSKELEVMREKMRRIRHKFDEFVPSTPAEKKQVADYQAAKAKLRALRLPGYFTGTHSIYQSGPGWYFAAISSPEVATECERVRQQVAELFRPYGLNTASARKALEAVAARIAKDSTLKPKGKAEVRREGDWEDVPVTLDYATHDSWPDLPSKPKGKVPGNGRVTVRIEPANAPYPGLCPFQPPKDCCYCLAYFGTSAPGVRVSIWTMTKDQAAHRRLTAVVREALKDVGIVLDDKPDPQHGMAADNSNAPPPPPGSPVLALAPVPPVDIPPEVERLLAAATLPAGKGQPPRPALSQEVKEGVARELRDAGRKAAYAKLDEKRRNVEWFAGIDELKRARAVWCLTSLLCHPHVDVQIKAARALGELKDRRAAPFLLAVAKANALHISGSENATLHGILQHALADALNTILGTGVKLKRGQDAEGLQAGLAVWKKAVATAHETRER